MSSQYSFQQAIFDLLAKKADFMAPEDKRGLIYFRYAFYHRKV
jgi:hypothetical protein